MSRTSSSRSASGHDRRLPRIATPSRSTPSDRSRPRAPLSSTPPRWWLEAVDPLPDPLISAPVRLQCPQKLFTVEQPPQLGQIHRLALQSERPRRPQGPLVGRIAEHARVGAVVLGLEQQIGHLPRSRVHQIGG